MKQRESYLATYTILEQPRCKLSTHTKCILCCWCQSTQLTLRKFTQAQYAYVSLSTTACEAITERGYRTLIYFKQPLTQNSLGSVILTRCSSVIPHARCITQLPCVSLERHVLLSYCSALSTVDCPPLCPVPSLPLTNQQVQAISVVAQENLFLLSRKECPCLMVK